MIQSGGAENHSAAQDQPIFLDPRGRRRMWLRLTAGVTAGSGVMALAACGVLLADRPSTTTSFALPIQHSVTPSFFGDMAARSGGGKAPLPASQASPEDGAARAEATGSAPDEQEPGSPSRNQDQSSVTGDFETDEEYETVSEDTADPGEEPTAKPTDEEEDADGGATAPHGMKYDHDGFHPESVADGDVEDVEHSEDVEYVEEGTGPESEVSEEKPSHDSEDAEDVDQVEESDHGEEEAGEFWYGLGGVHGTDATEESEKPGSAEKPGGVEGVDGVEDTDDTEAESSTGANGADDGERPGQSGQTGEVEAVEPEETSGEPEWPPVSTFSADEWFALAGDRWTTLPHAPES
ncbi:putative sodium/potassium/calcium exchanger [Saccharomonospora glauca]|mgnify:CR=1 FL=1|uniref:Uncharacterized protein n=1 Tax=Saccharomonospora glauca K62 TaxID=928724 RepID=I1D4Q2_9PSEU|nr:hypothetical protein [Saccharomonospora glauca]EIE99926.1 hypothetical protein SacglDRAFT_03060 [Saccharomonospora glauca K62]